MRKGSLLLTQNPLNTPSKSVKKPKGRRKKKLRRNANRKRQKKGVEKNVVENAKNKKEEKEKNRKIIKEDYTSIFMGTSPEREGNTLPSFHYSYQTTPPIWAIVTSRRSSPSSWMTYPFAIFELPRVLVISFFILEIF